MTTTDSKIVAECWTCWHPGRCFCARGKHSATACKGRPRVPARLTDEPYIKMYRTAAHHRAAGHDVRPVAQKGE